MIQPQEIAVNNNTKYTVNLFHKNLLPKKPFINLTRVIVFWFFILCCTLAWAFYLSVQSSDLLIEQKKLSTQENELKQLSLELENKIKNSKLDPILQNKLSAIKMLIANKRGLHAHLTNVKSVNSQGFSSAMTELSKYHYKDISLQQFSILPDGITFTGLAKSPEAIPLWLTGFEKSDFFSGRKFSQLSMSENENQQTVFSISALIKANNEQ